MTRKVGDDHAIGLHKLRDHPKPGEGELPWTVQQDDRRAVTPDEHRGRDTSQHQLSLRDRGRVQQLLTGAVAATFGVSVLYTRITHGDDLPRGTFRHRR